MAGKILIIDDEKDMLVLLKRILSGKVPHEVVAVNDPTKVPAMLEKDHYDVVITDLKMPGLDGVHILEMAKERDADTAVIIMTAYGTIESAIEATHKGALDYITKPFRKERMLHVVEQAIKWQQLRKENALLKEQLRVSPQSSALLGNSAAMQKLRRQIQQVAKTTATVLITGESGTGKELVARAVHVHSLRKDKPFIPVDCSTIPETLIESELFGHVRGSFTGASTDKKGLVEEANQGTLFLDEIGDLSLAMQVKLLRLLQEGEYKVVGTSSIRKADVRFITATNKPLLEKIKTGEFREDLYYRLNVINIHLPTLHERREDIPHLVQHFLQKYNTLHGKKVDRVSQEALDHLVHRQWPGNVRELGNVIERGVILASGWVLDISDLDLTDKSLQQPCPNSLVPVESIFSLPFKEAKDKLLDEFQVQYITKMLARHSGNISQAAKDSGIKRQYLHRLIREINVDTKSYKKPESK
jgi:DNA-binding NtrC family response regulator